MTLLALGINHKTAPISLRERVAFTSETLNLALNSLLQQPLVQGGVILSTCNRTELYLSVEQLDSVREQLVNWLCNYHQLSLHDMAESIYWHQDDKAVEHLMRVASGLDSLILGEPQILGQVKKAFAESQRVRALSTELERLFQKSFSVAKRVRTETEIGSHAVSVAFAACALARQIFESLKTLKVMLIGAGETIELVARYLNEHQVRHIIIANRTKERAKLLADDLQAEAITLAEIGTRLPEVDVVISSTASPLPLIGKGLVENTIKQRRHQPMLFVDIAVPRDIEPEVGDIDSVYLYSVDDLHSIIQHNLAQRQAAAQQAETIIQQEGVRFMEWLKAQSATEIIRDYRQQADTIRYDIESRALQDLRQGVDAETVVRELAYRLTNKLTHAPTKLLQEAAGQQDFIRLQWLRNRLGLD